MKIKSSTIWFIWVSLITYVIVDNIFLKNTIDINEALGKSSFARTMFWDIGVLSMILSYWTVYKTDLKSRYFFGILTLFVGSFAFLPYLALYLKDKEKNG